MSIVWALVGYWLAFSGDAPALGNFDRVLLLGIGMDSVSPLAKTIPETLFMIYQMTFAIITVRSSPARSRTACASRRSCCSRSLWLFIVYVPLAHWVWGGGFLQSCGVLDFAGGTVVHINAGVAGLVAALVLGKRRGFGNENLAPYDLSLAVIGTGLLWVGWFGFNGGSALSAGPRASWRSSPRISRPAPARSPGWPSNGGPRQTFRARHHLRRDRGPRHHHAGVRLRAAVAWHRDRRRRGGGCYWACTKLKPWLGYDDSLDVFGVHGVGGIIGMTAHRRIRDRRDLDRPRDAGRPAWTDRRQPAPGAHSARRVLVTVAWSGV